MTNTANTATDTGTAPRCWQCGNPDTRWITYLGEQCLQCDVCERNYGEHGTTDIGAIEQREHDAYYYGDSSDSAQRTATQRRVDEYRDSIAGDSDEYRELLARAMRCDAACTCKGTR